MLSYEHFVIVISSPSGAGKSTLTQMLLKKFNNLKLSVSATTRLPRIGEIDGKHYYFLTKDEFDKNIKNDEFLEYATVYDRSYGTLKSEINKKFEEGNDVLLDIDWQGNRLVAKQITDNKKILKIFILPPSIKELRKRLEGRDTDTKEIIDKRMSDAINTASHYNEYDHVIINDNLENAFEELCSLIKAKKISNVKKEAISRFVNNLIDE